jgi:hypothetical protein
LFLGLVEEIDLSVDSENILGQEDEVHAIQQRYQKGAALILRSAELGFSPAQHLCAVFHSLGWFGVEKNEGKAVLNDYFAAMDGDPSALMAMGSRYANGYLVQKDCVAAQQYYGAAAERAMELEGRHERGKMHLVNQHPEPVLFTSRIPILSLTMITLTVCIISMAVFGYQNEVMFNIIDFDERSSCHYNTCF